MSVEGQDACDHRETTGEGQSRRRGAASTACPDDSGEQLDHNLLIATWNLRAFGGLTEKWAAGPDYGDLARIAEIVSRFDVIAMQEVRGDIKALRHLLKTLGDEWAMILTDVTKGKAGNDERMAFLFDTRRVRPSGMACELVMPEEQGGRQSARGFRQFARTPYAVSFLAAGREYRATFILVTLHVIYGKQASYRSDELKGIAEWLADWAHDVNGFDQNLIALGDFNIDRAGDATTRPSFPRDCGYRRSSKANRARSSRTAALRTTSIRSRGSPVSAAPRHSHFVMRIKAGTFDFVNAVHHDLTREEVSWKISDHYPLWVEFLLHND